MEGETTLFIADVLHLIVSNVGVKLCRVSYCCFGMEECAFEENGRFSEVWIFFYKEIIFRVGGRLGCFIFSWRRCKAGFKCLNKFFFVLKL